MAVVNNMGYIFISRLNLLGVHPINVEMNFLQENYFNFAQYKQLRFYSGYWIDHSILTPRYEILYRCTLKLHCSVCTSVAMDILHFRCSTGSIETSYLVCSDLSLSQTLRAISSYINSYIQL